MSKWKNQNVWFILNLDKHAYKWTHNESKENGIMVDIQLVMDSKDNL
jgi:hypothetical protein